MVKATRKCAVLLALLAIGMAASAMPSYAETQNVKIGGDVTVRSFVRSNLDLQDQSGALDGDNFIEQTTGINISADLTENVSTFVRIANESNWGGVNSTNTASGDLDISQGYIKLKDLFTAPVTLTLGRQPIVWGRGFVLGSNLIPSVFGADDRNTSIDNNEFTDFTAFDGARATIDLSGNAAVSLPLAIDMVYLKQREGTAGLADDQNIMGINLGTKTDMAEFETYYLNKNDKSPTPLGAANNEDSSVSTFGIRGSARPIEGSNIYGELAYQWGTRNADISGGTLPSGDAQQAWAANLGAEMGFKDVVTSPKVGAEWIFYSGKDVDGAAQGWDPIARGYFTTALREFQTGGASGFYGTSQPGDTSAATNQNQLSLYGSMKPLEDLTIAPRLSWFILDIGAKNNITANTGSSKRSKFAGTEWDTVATYNYTDDVQFQMIYGIFWPGTVYRTPNDNIAQELVSSVSVKF